METLITHPVTMTHAVMAPAERLRVGITDGLRTLDKDAEIKELSHGWPAEKPKALDQKQRRRLNLDRAI